MKGFQILEDEKKENKKVYSDPLILGYSSRSFDPIWKLTYGWVRYDKEKKLMYCSLCEKYSLNKDQTMIQGCKVFHKNSLKQHEKSKFHKLSKEAELNHHNMTTIVKRKIGG